MFKVSYFIVKIKGITMKATLGEPFKVDCRGSGFRTVPTAAWNVNLGHLHILTIGIWGTGQVHCTQRLKVIVRLKEA
jgi:hypothetical protein